MSNRIRFSMGRFFLVVTLLCFAAWCGTKGDRGGGAGIWLVMLAVWMLFERPARAALWTYAAFLVCFILALVIFCIVEMIGWVVK